MLQLHLKLYFEDTSAQMSVIIPSEMQGKVFEISHEALFLSQSIL